MSAPKINRYTTEPGFLWCCLYKMLLSMLLIHSPTWIICFECFFVDSYVSWKWISSIEENCNVWVLNNLAFRSMFPSQNDHHDHDHGWKLRSERARSWWRSGLISSGMGSINPKIRSALKSSEGSEVSVCFVGCHRYPTMRAPLAKLVCNWTD